MSSKRERILVAMSGGVDSSVAAALLKSAGHEVIGTFMSNGIQAERPTAHQGCCGIEDAADARRVAENLGIPFYVLDLSRKFDELIEAFAAAYAAGRTPNPCIECNRTFKFGALLEMARDLGAARVATGHYARLVGQAGERMLARARDAGKDQSYVLWPLGFETLQQVEFPLGELTKDEVRAEARRMGLRTADKPESMEICFVPGGDYRAIVRERQPAALAAGDVVDVHGKVLGQHEGIAGFTIGQRRGLPAGQAEPMFVVRIDASERRVVVGPRSALAATRCRLDGLVFGSAQPWSSLSEVNGFLQVRAHHRAVAVRVQVAASNAYVDFREPVDAVTPGQSAVLYDEQDCVVLGGVIASTEQAAMMGTTHEV
jgi:tRNA-specific 2-thiouridylase